MKKRVVWVIASVLLAGAWYLFRPERLFIDARVDEEFPGATAALSGPSGPEALLSGRFHGVAHATSGVATIYGQPGGERVLRLTGFETSNGPDVRVYLVAAPDATDNEAVPRAGFVEIGPLKGNVGDQNYDIPAELDLDRYRAVTIWCRRFGVNFGTAPLKNL